MQIQIFLVLTYSMTRPLDKKTEHLTPVLYKCWFLSFVATRSMLLFEMAELIFILKCISTSCPPTSITLYCQGQYVYRWQRKANILCLNELPSCHFTVFLCPFRYRVHHPLVRGHPRPSPSGPSSGLCRTAEVRELHHPTSSRPFWRADHSGQSVLHQLQPRYG